MGRLKPFDYSSFLAVWLLLDTVAFAAVPVTIAANTQGRAFTVSGAGCAPGSYLTPQTLQWTTGSNCTVTFVSPHSLQSGTRFVFTGWQDNATGNPRTIAAPAQTATYTAAFSTQYLLALTANPPEGGTVTGGGWVTAGLPTPISAIPSPGFRFVSWSGGANLPVTSSGSATLFSGPSTATASFSPVTPPLSTAYTVLPILSNINNFGMKPINSSGQVVGASFNSSAPLLWVPSVANGAIGSLKDLGPSPVANGSVGATAINDAGQIAAIINGSPSRVVLWSPDGASFQTITNPTRSSIALNNYGQVAGDGFIWTPNTANGSTGTLTTGNQFANLIGLNAFGQAILNSDGFSQSTGALFTPSSMHGTAGTFTQVPGLAGGTQHSLVAINGTGVVLGYSCIAVAPPSFGCRNHAFLWKPVSDNASTGSTSEITLPNGFVSMQPTAMNDRGEVIGTMTSALSGQVSFLYSGGIVYDLSTASTLIVGFTPNGINNFGQIVFGSGFSVYLATPAPANPPPPPNAVPITITSNTQGRPFTVAGTGCAPGGYMTPQTLQWTPSSNCTITFVSPQSFLPGTRFIFSGWQDASGNPRTITAPAQTTTYNATFSTQYLLTVLANPADGGTVTGSGWVTGGIPTPISATASPGYRFNGWTGPLTLPSTSSGTVVLNNSATVTATFAAATTPLTTHYTVLPILDSGNVSGPKPINATGQVVSTFFSAPVIWAPSTANGSVGNVNDLGQLPSGNSTSGPATINDAGEIAAIDTGSFPSKVVLWSPLSGKFQVINDSNSGSVAINNYGQVGGSGFIWTPASPNATTGTLTTGSQFNNLVGLNAYGQAIMQPTGFPQNTGALFTPSSAHGVSGAFTPIAGLAGGQQTSLVAINETGTIVGYTCVSQPSGSCQNHAFLWKPAGPNAASGLISEILLPNGIGAMQPIAINNNGDVVGTMTQVLGNQVPFLYSGGTVYDLTNAGTFFVGAIPYGINDFGQIVLKNNSVYLATPTPTNPQPPANAVPVTITNNNQGRGFTVSGTGCAPGFYLTPQTLLWTPGSNCTITFASPQSTQSGTRFVFSGWQDNTSANPRTITAPVQPTTYAASFSVQYLLTVQANPPEGGAVTGGGWVNGGVPALVTATANPGYRFAGWSGGVNPSSSSSGTVVLNGSLTVSASFAPTTSSLTTNYTVVTILNNADIRGPKPINSLGQIVGTTSFGPEVLLWSPSVPNTAAGSLVDLGTTLLASFSSPVAINNVGQIVAVNNDSPSKVVLWSPGSGGFQPITNSTGNTVALNNYGQVGGSGFIWTPASANATTGTLTTDSRFNNLVGLNGFGQALLNPSGFPQTTATLFTPSSAHGTSGVFTPIPSLAGAQQTTLVSINETGVVVGYSCITQANFGCRNHAFLWKPDSPNAPTGIISEIVLPNGFVAMAPKAMNNNGDVVGTMTPVLGNDVPFLYSGSVVYDLTPAGPLFMSTTPSGINDFGQIALDGSSSVYLATPTPANSLPPPNAVPVTITDNTQGRVFTVSGAGCTPGSYSTPRTLQWTPGSNCTVTFVSPHSVQVGTRFIFLGWQDGVSGNPRTFATPAIATTYTATFTTQYLLTIAARPPEGGTVTGGGWVNGGIPTPISATASMGYRFAGWTGGINLPTTNSGSVILSSGPAAVTATFAPITASLTTTYTVLPILNNAEIFEPKPLNSSGQVTGRAFSPSLSRTVPFLWAPSSVNAPVGSLNDLGPLPSGGSSFGPVTINDAGQIATIDSGASPSKVVLWSPSSGSYQIIADSNSSSVALNNYGQVGGSGFIWTPASANATTGMLTTGSQFNNLVALNTFGQAIMNPTGFPQTSATLFTPSSAHATSGAFTPIVGLAGGQQTTLVAINDTGAVIGYTCITQPNSSCLNHAFLWKPAAPNVTSGVTLEIPLPNGFVSMQPSAINSNGDVVGTMTQVLGTEVSFLYSGGVIYDLTPASPLLTSSDATGINDFGQIVFGADFSGGTVYLATPINPMPAQVTVTVTSSPAGVVFQADGSTFNTPATFQWQPLSTHTVSFAPIQTGAGQRLAFVNWSDNQTDSTRQIVVPQNGGAYIANYAVQFGLALNAAPPNGGMLIANPASSDGFYNSGTAVRLTAVPNSGYQFTGFSGSLSGSTNGQTIIMDSAKSVTANFSSVQNPSIEARIRNDVSQNAQPGPTVTVALQLANTGSGAAKGIRITGLEARAVAPAPETLAVNKTLPVNVGDIASGASSGNIQIPVTIPSTARRIVLVVTGTVQNLAGELFNFSSSVTIVR